LATLASSIAHDHKQPPKRRSPGSFVAHCHLGLGKLFRNTGKREQAHEHLATAMAMYRDMDMQFWLELAEAELNQLFGAALA
jgi:hypothetical protein